MLSDQYSAALCFAAKLHQDQVRKSTAVPYLSHLLAVSGLVLEYGGDEEEAIAGLLHDAIEDQGPNFVGGSDGLRQEIESRFGSRVLSIVEACTDADEHPKPPWRERKESYVAHLATADKSALLVSCADKLHNARTICSELHVKGNEVWNLFKGGKGGTLWYYRAVTGAIASRTDGPVLLVAELNRTVSEMERIAEAVSAEQ